MLTPRERAAVGFAVALLGALGPGCAVRAPAPDPSPTPPPNAWSDFTRDLLAVHCGRCHRRDLATAVPRALAVFDLLDDPWYGRLAGEQFETMLVRLRAIEDLPPADLDAATRFVACARDGRCDMHTPVEP